MTSVEAFDARRALRAEGLLRVFNDIGVLAAADVQVAARLSALAGETGEAVALGAALAVRSPRLGHVCVDLATAHRTVTADADEPVDLETLPWPDPQQWPGALAASPLVATGTEVPEGRPLRLDGTRLYLDRYWREERRVAVDLLARAGAAIGDVDEAALADGLARLFGPRGDALQRRAAEAAVRRRLVVVAGGPGTGKTTTVARILALLDEQAVAAGAPPPRVAIAAPTGKAGARLEEAVHGEAAELGVASQVRERLLALTASTLHRLLGWRPDSRSRFRHHGGNHLPHDVVVVDETSMVSLTLMARLVEAVAPHARLILVGDPEQLASVEAGAVLGDIVGPASGEDPVDGPLAEGIVVLRRVHRYRGGIAELATAIQRADPDGVVEVLAAGTDDVEWIAADAAEASEQTLAPVRRAVVDASRRVHAAALAGDGMAALAALGAVRVLCAHRRGPHGASTWMEHVESWLAAEVPGYGTGGRWYVGRPLLVTENDYGLQLFNGDTGVVVARDGDTVTAVFERRGETVELSPARLASVDTVHAMTVHKAQGSQFDHVAVLLPDAASPILTRELLYTAVTRAQSRLTIVGTAEAVRAAVTRPIARASGLRAALWTA